MESQNQSSHENTAHQDQSFTVLEPHATLLPSASSGLPCSSVPRRLTASRTAAFSPGLFPGARGAVAWALPRSRSSRIWRRSPASGTARRDSRSGVGRRQESRSGCCSECSGGSYPGQAPPRRLRAEEERSRMAGSSWRRRSAQIGIARRRLSPRGGNVRLHGRLPICASTENGWTQVGKDAIST